MTCSKNTVLSGVPTMQMEMPLLLISCVSAPIRLLPFLLLTTFRISSTINRPILVSLQRHIAPDLLYAVVVLKPIRTG